MAINRTQLGLLMADTFEDGDTSDWSKVDCTFDPDTDIVRFGNYSARYQRVTGTAGARLARSAGPWTDDSVWIIWFRVNALTTHSMALTQLNIYPGIQYTLWGGNICYYDTAFRALQPYQPDTWYEIKSVIHWSSKTFDAYIDNALKKADAAFRGSPASLQQFRVGESSYPPTTTKHYHDNIVWMQSQIVSCTDLPSGYKLRVTGAAGSTATATESGGRADVDCSALDFPCQKLEVLDATNQVVETLLAPDDIWGGDEYSYTAEAPPEEVGVRTKPRIAVARTKPRIAVARTRPRPA